MANSDFKFWKIKIEDYLYQKKLYLPLTTIDLMVEDKE